MSELYVSDINLADVIMFLIIPLSFIVQLILCFRVKHIAVKIIPTALFTLTTLALFIAVFAAQGWEAIGYLILAVWSAIILAACLIPWAIYLIYRLVKKYLAAAENDGESKL